MKYQSTLTHQSKAYPDVSFTVRHLTEGRRIKISLSLADKYDKIDALQRGAIGPAERAKPLIDEAKAKGGDLPAGNADLMELLRLQRQVASVNDDEIMPAYVKALLVSVDGLEIDGAAATPETMAESGPPDLYAEIVKAVKREMGLSDEESGNSESPSISSALVDGETPVTSAETVGVAAIPS